MFFVTHWTHFLSKLKHHFWHYNIYCVTVTSLCLSEFHTELNRFMIENKLSITNFLVSKVVKITTKYINFTYFSMIVIFFTDVIFSERQKYEITSFNWNAKTFQFRFSENIFWIIHKIKKSVLFWRISFCKTVTFFDFFFYFFKVF